MIDNKKYELIKFEDGDFSLDVNVSPNEETVWLSLESIANLFERDKSVISRHIKNIFSDFELNENSVVAFFATTAIDGKSYIVKHYNLDMILAIGYRVKSKRGIIFRKWTSSILKQYLLNGHVIDQTRCLAYSDSLIKLSNHVDLLKSEM